MIDVRIEMDVLDVKSEDAGTNSRREFEHRVRRLLADVVTRGRIVVYGFQREKHGESARREAPRIVIQAVATPDGGW